MSLISLIVYLAVIGLVAYLATYVLGQFPPPDPLGRVLRVAIIVVAVLLVIYVLLGAFGLGSGLPVLL